MNGRQKKKDTVRHATVTIHDTNPKCPHCQGTGLVEFVVFGSETPEIIRKICSCAVTTESSD